MSNREFIREFWGDIFSLAFSLIVGFTFLLIYLNGGRLWVFEELWFIRWTEYIMCIIAIFLSLERLVDDILDYTDER